LLKTDARYNFYEVTEFCAILCINGDGIDIIFINLFTIRNI